MAIRVTNLNTQVLINPLTISRAITHDMGLAVEPEKREIQVQSLGMEVLMEAEEASFASATDTAEFFGIALNQLLVGDREVPTNHLGFNSFVISDSFPQIFQELGFTQVARASLLNAAASNNLSFVSFVEYCIGTPWDDLEVTHPLGLTQKAGLAKAYTATNDLGFSDSIERNRYSITQSLGFIQRAQDGQGNNITVVTPLGLQAGLVTTNDLGQTVIHTPFVSHSMAYYIDSVCGRRLYQKFEGEGQDSAGFADERLEFEADFVLETLSGPKSQLVLRAPEPDDRDRLGFNRVNRETRGGELDIFSDPAWAKVNTLLFTIVALKPDKITALQDFLQNTLGQEILLQDWTGSSWKGIVTTPNESATEDGEGFWTFTFEFEGVPYEGSANDQSLDFSDNGGVNADFVRSLEDDLGFESVATAGGVVNSSGSENDLGFKQLLSAILEAPVIEHFFSGDGTDFLDQQALDTSPPQDPEFGAYDVQGVERVYAWPEYTDDGMIYGTAASAMLFPLGQDFLVADPTLRDYADGQKRILNGPHIYRAYIRNINKDVLYQEDFGGAAVTLNGVTPDKTIGDDFQSADTFLADGTFAGDTDSTGMYLPFAPVDGKVYVLEAKVRDLDSTGEADNDFTLMLAKDVSSSAGDTGDDAAGYADPTTLRAAHVFRSQNGNNGVLLGDATASEYSADYSDEALRDTEGDIDLRINLDTRGGTGTWKVIMYAKAPESLTWTNVSGELALEAEDIAAVGVGIGSSLTGTLTSFKLYEDTSVNVPSGSEIRFICGKTFQTEIPFSNVAYLALLTDTPQDVRDQLYEDGFAAFSSPTIAEGFIIDTMPAGHKANGSQYAKTMMAIRSVDGTGSNCWRYEKNDDPLANTVVFSDEDLKEEVDEIDLKVHIYDGGVSQIGNNGLNNAGQIGLYRAQFFARRPGGEWVDLSGIVSIDDEFDDAIAIGTTHASLRFEVDYVSLHYTREY